MKSSRTIEIRRPARAALAVAAGMLSSGAMAVSIDTGNEDVVVRFDNSLRYNFGLRAQKRNEEAYNTTSLDDSDAKFKRGDVVASRLDLLSEFDVRYKSRQGLRVSASAWYDAAYHDSSLKPNPAFDVPGLGNISSAYPGDEYSSYTKRWNRGPSGQLLDAFVFGGFDVGTVPVDLKLGQHNVYWGESLFSFIHGVSYSQSPVDIRKAFANPGVVAKELFLPLNQLSATAQLSETVSVAAQYLLDWKPPQLPDAGTYLAINDFLTDGGGTYVINPAAAIAAGAQFGLPPGAIAPVEFVGTPNAPKKRGDWGVKASWRPAGANAALGLYYREYTDKIPEIVLGGFQPGLPIPSDVRFTFLEGAKLYGVSLATEVAGVSIGSELTYRKNGGLLMNGATVAGSEPRGNTVHALVNAIVAFQKSALFDFAALQAELTYSRLSKVTANPDNYNGLGYGCATNDKFDGCSTRDAYGIALRFEPVWYQAISGVDVSAPMFISTGLKGNSPVLFGGYQGNGFYSLGIAGDFLSRYNVALNYNGFLVKYKTTPNALGQPSVGNVNGIGYAGDRGWVSLTVKASF